MPDGRTVILERIRSATRGDASAGLAADRAGVPRPYIRTGALGEEARLALFVERLRDYDAHVVETTAAALPQTILSLLRERGESRVIAADGLPPEILPGGFAFMPERDATVDDLNRCDGIITICTVAIAATGTIVLAHGAGEGARRLTLLPDRHCCVVRAGQVVETVPEAIDRLAPFATDPLTFISGPSATADIEMTRIRGVHGPRFLDVVLVR
jgi:L-lactate dehydrogenase complex protein LldG